MNADIHFLVESEKWRVESELLKSAFNSQFSTLNSQLISTWR